MKFSFFSDPLHFQTVKPVKGRPRGKDARGGRGSEERRSGRQSASGRRIDATIRPAKGTRRTLCHARPVQRPHPAGRKPPKETAEQPEKRNARRGGRGGRHTETGSQSPCVFHANGFRLKDRDRCAETSARAGSRWNGSLSKRQVVAHDEALFQCKPGKPI